MGEEEVLQPGFLRFGHVDAIDQHNAGLGQRLAQFAPLRLLVLDQQHDAFGNARQLFGGRQAFRALLGYAGPHLGAKAGDADHKEFVEVVCRDRKEFKPLQQRMAAVGGFLQHAPVEIKPG